MKNVNQEFHTFKIIFNNELRGFLRSIKPYSPNEPIPSSFWKVGYYDFFCFFIFFTVSVSIWLATYLTGDFKSIIAYWDGPNYVYAAITLYEIPRDNPWFQLFGYKPDYFACHLPGYPLLIRLCSFFTCSNYIYADFLSIIICNFLIVYSFRRFLMVYNCVSNPILTTCLLSLIPMRFTIYHSVIASEPLFITLVCFSLIFYKINSFSAMLISVWGCCIIRIEGMAVGFAIGLCFLLLKDIWNALKMFLTFVPILILLLFHYAMFSDMFAYVHFNSGVQHLVTWPPFPEIRSFKTDYDILHLHSFIDFFIPLIIGTICLFKHSGPIAIFSFVNLIYVSLLQHLDLYRYSLPAAVFSYLIGFDVFWSSKYGKSICILGLPLYFVGILIYSSGQIHSNRCSDQFLDAVFDAAKESIH